MLKRINLKNQIDLLAIPMNGTKTITVLVLVGTGSKYEDRKNNGISHFLEHLFFKGTKKRPAPLIINSDLDILGAEFNAYTSKEYTGFWVKAEAGKIEKVMDILSDMLLYSNFDKNEIDRERGVIIEEINMYQDNPMMLIEDIFENCLYGDIPAGWDTLGPKENIINIIREDILSYFNSQYRNSNIVVCIAGNVNKKVNYQKMVNTYFNKKGTKNNNAFAEKAAVKENQMKPLVKIHYKKTDQAHLALGVRSFSYDHQERIIAKIISIILGGSMSSRLFMSLREREGLCYYVHTNVEAYTDTGYLLTRAGVPVDKVERAIQVILDEYKRISEEKVSYKELKRIKDLLSGRVAIQMESSDHLAEWYGRQAIMLKTLERSKEIKMKISSPEEYLKEIGKITANDIKRVAKKIFLERGLNLAIIGPYDDQKKFEKILSL